MDQQSLAAIVAEARARAAAATPGPWSGEGSIWSLAPEEEARRTFTQMEWIPNGEGYQERDEQVERDAAFIAAARTDVPALADGLERALALLERLTRPGVTFIYVAEEGIICGLCDAQAWREEEMIHKPGCLVLDAAAFLTGASGSAAPAPITDIDSGESLLL